IAGNLHQARSCQTMNGERRKCEVDGCSNFATFFFLVIVGTFQTKPKARANTKTIAVCDSCFTPKGGRWQDAKRKAGYAVWTSRTELLKKLESINDETTGVTES